MKAKTELMRFFQVTVTIGTYSGRVLEKGVGERVIVALNREGFPYVNLDEIKCKQNEEES